MLVSKADVKYPNHKQLSLGETVHVRHMPLVNVVPSLLELCHEPKFNSDIKLF